MEVSAAISENERHYNLSRQAKKYGKMFGGFALALGSAIGIRYGIEQRWDGVETSLSAIAGILAVDGLAHHAFGRYHRHRARRS